MHEQSISDGWVSFFFLSKAQKLCCCMLLIVAMANTWLSRGMSVLQPWMIQKHQASLLIGQKHTCIFWACGGHLTLAKTYCIFWSCDLRKDIVNAIGLVGFIPVQEWAPKTCVLGFLICVTQNVALWDSLTPIVWLASSWNGTCLGWNTERALCGLCDWRFDYCMVVM